MSLRENAHLQAVGSGAKMGRVVLAYGDATGLFATHKIIDLGEETAEITEM